jgi:hypothetical protein
MKVRSLELMRLVEDGRDIGGVTEFLNHEGTARFHKHIWPVGLRWCTFAVEAAVSLKRVHALKSDDGTRSQRITITEIHEGGRVVAFVEEDEGGNFSPTPLPSVQRVATEWDEAPSEEPDDDDALLDSRVRLPCE